MRHQLGILFIRDIGKEGPCAPLVHACTHHFYFESSGREDTYRNFEFGKQVTVFYFSVNKISSMQLLFVVIMVLTVFSCSSDDNKKNRPQKEVPVLNRTFTTSIGIYFLDKDSISVKRFNDEARKALPGFILSDSLVDSIIHDSYYIKYIKNPSRDFTPPDTDYLKHAGPDLTTAEKIKLQHAAGALSVVFFGTKENVIGKQKKILELVNTVSEGKHVIIADYNTIECFNTNSWRTKRVNNFYGEHKDVTGQITIHLYREDEFCRAVTLGMDKFCLPDISVKDISCNDQNSFGNLINAAVQTLFENPIISEDSSLHIDLLKIQNDSVKKYLTTDLKANAKKIATIKLKSVTPEEGDNVNTQFLIEFKNPTFSSPQEEQNAMLSGLFGADDAIVHTDHDAEILKVSEEARLRLPELQARFNKGLEPGYSLLIKAPFKTDNGGREWMWVEITKWKNESITGILQNDPFEIAKLKAGAIVKANQKDVFDYILYKPDGTYEGNETGKILEKRK